MYFAQFETQTVQQSMTIANGKAGAVQTLRLMRQIIDRYKTNPLIRETAMDVIYLQPEKDEPAEVRALYEFVRDSIRYIRDINNVETIQTPDKTMQFRAGDCDDQTTLLCTLIEAVGYPTRLVAAGYHNPAELEHVYCEALAGGQWIGMDPTERAYSLGQTPPNPVAYWVERV